MRTINIILLSISIMISNVLFANNSRTKIMNVAEVEISDFKIDSVLNNIAVKYQNYLNQKGLIAIEILKINNNNYNINIVVYNKVRFDSFCQRNGYPITGYLYCHDYLVFMIGRVKSDFIRKIKNNKEFEFKYIQNKQIKGKVPPPPAIYDPPTYVYKYKNGIIKLLHR
jgi:hypothetical protein